MQVGDLVQVGLKLPQDVAARIKKIAEQMSSQPIVQRNAIGYERTVYRRTTQADVICMAMSALDKELAQRGPTPAEVEEEIARRQAARTPPEPQA